MFWNLLPVKKYNNFTSKFRESQYFQIFHWGNYKHFSRGQMKNQQFFPLVWKSSKTNYHQSTFHNFSHWSFPLKTQQFLGKDLFSAKCLLDIIWLAELFHRLGVLTLFSLSERVRAGYTTWGGLCVQGACSWWQACTQPSSVCWLLPQASAFQFSVLSFLSINVPPNSREVSRKFPSNVMRK